MARIRSIKPEFWTDEKLSALRPIDRLVFLGLIGLADDAGRLLDNPKILNAGIFPGTDDSVAESLSILEGLGRIARGKTASGQPVLQIVNWARHQKVDHPNLRACLPEIASTGHPAEALAIDSRGSREALANDSRPARDSIYDLRSATNDQRPTSERADNAAPAPSALPAGFVDLVEAWNRAAQSYGLSKCNPTAKLAGRYETACRRDPELVDAAASPFWLERAVATADWGRGKAWFTLPGLLGGNKDGRTKLLVLRDGGYRGDPPKNATATARPFRPRIDVEAALAAAGVVDD